MSNMPRVFTKIAENVPWIYHNTRWIRDKDEKGQNKNQRNPTDLRSTLVSPDMDNSQESTGAESWFFR